MEINLDWYYKKVFEEREKKSKAFIKRVVKRIKSGKKIRIKNEC